jgi:hypothetical protein
LIADLDFRFLIWIADLDFRFLIWIADLDLFVHSEEGNKAKMNKTLISRTANQFQEVLSDSVRSACPEIEVIREAISSASATIINPKS